MTSQQTRVTQITVYDYVKKLNKADRYKFMLIVTVMLRKHHWRKHGRRSLMRQALRQWRYASAQSTIEQAIMRWSFRRWRRCYEGNRIIRGSSNGFRALFVVKEEEEEEDLSTSPPPSPHTKKKVKKKLRKKKKKKNQPVVKSSRRTRRKRARKKKLQHQQEEQKTESNDDSKQQQTVDPIESARSTLQSCWVNVHLEGRLLAYVEIFMTMCIRHVLNVLCRPVSFTEVCLDIKGISSAAGIFMTCMQRAARGPMVHDKEAEEEPAKTQDKKRKLRAWSEYLGKVDRVLSKSKLRSLLTTAIENTPRLFAASSFVRMMDFVVPCIRRFQVQIDIMERVIVAGSTLDIVPNVSRRQELEWVDRTKDVPRFVIEVPINVMTPVLAHWLEESSKIKRRNRHVNISRVLGALRTKTYTAASSSSEGKQREVKEFSGEHASVSLGPE